MVRLRAWLLALSALVLGAAVALPIAGVGLPSVFYALPVVAGTALAWLGRIVMRELPGRRAVWLLWRLAAVLSVVWGVVSTILAAVGHEPKIGFSVAVVATAVLFAGHVLNVRHVLRTANGWALLDPLIVAGAAVALPIQVALAPAFLRGDPLLAFIFAVDLVIVCLAVVAVLGTMPRTTKVGIVAGAVLFAVADGFVATESAGLASVPEGVLLLIITAGMLMMGWAATCEIIDAQPHPHRPEPIHHARLMRADWTRALLPIGPMLVPPVVCVVLWNLGRLTLASLVYWALWLTGLAVVALGRQAAMLVENRRRAAELKATADLTAAIVDNLDEQPLIDAGREVIRDALGARSAEIVLAGAPEPVLAPGEQSTFATLPLRATGRNLGALRLERDPGATPLDASPLARVLVDQLAIGIVNAREHRHALLSAVRDPVTGLYNRRYFAEALDKELQRHRRYGSVAALVVFDVDRLKAVNDHLGGDGDRVLRRIAEVAQPHTRPSDSMARTGGGEFALLMPETGQLDALLAAERIRAAVARSRIIGDIPVTISGGVAALPQDGTTRAELERRAAEAMAWAKDQGRNLCAVAREAVPERSPVKDSAGMLNHLHAVVSGIDSSHLYTRDHSENVSAYSVAVAQQLGLPEDRIVRLRRAAFLHDIGKIAVPDEVLAKPSKLTDREYEQIKVHTEVGGHMLAHAGLEEEAYWVRHHHERIDGRGYPDGISGDALTLESRIIFVSDSFEAMTSDRPYRLGMPVGDAVAELRRCAGTQFDPIVVDALCSLVETGQLRIMSLRH